ncbi:Diaminopimelate decarboxylase [Caloramator mitchellensis]|uniref:Diaminopimelate decarboxylase n=1 Tax=Caloramator mitchellensis TaxID=908809 RepID=A0A0R3K355_CALMK|nr:diaminopimelate decarboxylase [Caloramator mitchellensis]KRQ87362.1 Diaminopimelate decarboxylase [Caloramator mitchellensis]
MFGYNSLAINEKGNLTISNVDAVKLAKNYGTPLYVVDEVEIIRRCREIKQNHMDKYSGRAVYASKAFLNKEMCRIINREGLGLDVVSGGELYTAKSVDFPMDRVIFHGNNKSLSELEMAIDFGVGRIVIDNFFEIENLNKILNHKNKTIDIQIRVNPGIDGHTHDYIKTGQVDSKFGFTLYDGAALNAVKNVLESPFLNLKGIHAHIGSQLHQKDIYITEVKVLAEFIKNIKDEFNYEIDEINVGGGFGIFYTEDDSRKLINYFTDDINLTVIKEFSRLNLKRPVVIIEPGRWIVGEAGFTIYTIGAIKEIPNIRKYISIDGGMADNPRPPLYGAKYLALIANKITQLEEELVTISGKCCESGDILIKDIMLPKVESGDILVVLSTGAYNYSMASNYNRLPRPAVVLVNNGEHRLIVRRETYEDIIRNDV